MKIQDYRQKIDEIDRDMVALFLRRTALCAEIAEVKRAEGLPVLDSRREQEKLDALAASVPPAMREDVQALYRELFRLSRGYQERLLNGDDE